MKHKHADLIHAWADGAKIQYNVPLHGDDWYDCKDVPQWGCAKVQFRIKPEEKKPVVRWLWAYPAGNGSCYTSRLYSLDEAAGNSDWVKLEWSRTEFPE